MSQEDTIEIDPSELSDEVREDLISDSDMSREEAKEFADKAQLEQMNLAEPDKKNIIELARRKVEKGVGRLRSAYRSLSERNALPVISDVEPANNNKIILHIKHPRLDDHKIYFERDEKEIPNLMAYHKVDNIRDLEGKKLVIGEIRSLDSYSHNFLPSNWHEVRLLIPNNVSFTGRVRYKLFSLVQDVRSKTNIQKVRYRDPTFYTDLFFSYVILFTSTFSASYGGELIFENNIVLQILDLSFFLTILVGISAFIWLTSRLILLVLYHILKGNFHEVEV